jgi:acyl-CoA thioesterase YciA
MDLAASSVATRHSAGRVATVALEGMSFLRPVKVGDEVSVFATLVGVGRTSMRIAVEAWRRPRRLCEQEKVTTAMFTFVAIGDDRRPRLLG